MRSFESFIKILEKIKPLARDRNKEADLLKKRVFVEFIQFENKPKKAKLTNLDEEKVASKGQKSWFRRQQRSR